jgi:NAD(P)-dependent dehydrogenase (short-subunit alcohol dehydrogenase family)
MSKLAPGEEASMEQVVTSAIPLGRMGDKSDIALACVYLASSAARCVSLCYPAWLADIMLLQKGICKV